VREVQGTENKVQGNKCIKPRSAQLHTTKVDTCISAGEMMDLTAARDTFKDGPKSA